MGMNASDYNQAVREERTCWNARADSAVINNGDALQYKTSAYDGFAVQQPSGTNLLQVFAGIYTGDVALAANDQRNNGLVVEGVVKCKYKNSANSVAGTWATPVSGQDYLAYSPVYTGIMLLTDRSSGTAVGLPTDTTPPKVWIMPRPTNNAPIQHEYWAAVSTASATAVHAAIADTGVTQTITTAITNPDVPRTITATPGGTTANMLAVQAIITGTNINGDVITETLPAFGAGSSTAKTGLKAFATVTQISLPSTGTSTTVSFGTGGSLGLRHKLPYNTVVMGAVNGTRESTAPVAVASTSDIALNVVSFTTAFGGNPIYCAYIIA